MNVYDRIQPGPHYLGSQAVHAPFQLSREIGRLHRDLAFSGLVTSRVPSRKPGGRKNIHYQRHLTPTIPRS